MKKEQPPTNKTIELTLNEALKLKEELIALLQTKCKIKVKFQIGKLHEQVQNETKIGFNLLQQLFKDFGVPGSNGGIFIKELEDDGTPTEGYKQHKELTEQKITLSVPEFDESVWDLETDYPIDILRKLM